MILVRVHEAEHTAVHRLEIFPVVLGRSIHCGVQIEDPSVSARHAEIDQDGDSYWLRDLESTNGIYSHGERINELRLSARQSLYFGEVMVDIITEDTQEKTQGNRPLPPEHYEKGRWYAAKIAAAVIVALFVSLVAPAIDQYKLFWPPDRPISLILRAIVLFSGIVSAAFVASLFCKLNVKKYYFHNLMLLISIAFILFKGIHFLSPIVIFNLHNAFGARFLRHVGNATIAYLFVYRLQRYALRRWHRGSRAAVGGVAALLSLIFTEVWIERQSGDRDQMAELSPATAMNLGIKQSVEDLLLDIGLTITSIDQERIRTLERLEADRDGEAQ